MEELIWGEVAGFVLDPEKTLDELRAGLDERFTGDGVLALEKHLQGLKGQESSIADPRALVYRQFGRSAMKEFQFDLDRQRVEIIVEEGLLTADVARLEREVEMRSDAAALLSGARRLINRLRARFEADLAKTSRAEGYSSSITKVS